MLRIAGYFVTLRAVFRSLAVFALLATACFGELVTLSIQPNSFPESSSVSVFVDAGLLGDDEVVSSLSGEITLDLLPSAVSPLTAQITELRGVVDNEIAFQVGGGFLLPTVTVDADAGDVVVRIVEPGEPAEILDAQFSQLSNLVGFDGTVTSSVQEEPFDLSAQEPTLADFTDIAITSDRTDLSVDASLLTSISIPIEVGIFSLEVLLDIDGSIAAAGKTPAANYTLLTSDNAAIGYGLPANWLRAGVAGTGSLPIAIDAVSIAGQPDVVNQVDLGAVAREAALVNVVGQVSLANGNLTTGELSIAAGSTLAFEATARLNNEVGETKVEVTGGGELQLDGITDADLVLVEGSLTGQGQVGSVLVGGSAALNLSPLATLHVDGELNFEEDSILRVTASAEDIGTFTLAVVGSIGSDDLAALPKFVNGVAINQGSLEHLGGGQFGQLEIGSTQIQFTGSQAAAGDADGNGLVEFADFLSLSASFGEEGGWLNGDFDGNGLVEFADFLVLSTRFGATVGPVAAVPEPATGWLLSLGWAALCLRPRRRRTS